MTPTLTRRSKIEAEQHRNRLMINTAARILASGVLFDDDDQPVYVLGQTFDADRLTGDERKRLQAIFKRLDPGKRTTTRRPEPEDREAADRQARQLERSMETADPLIKDDFIAAMAPVVDEIRGRGLPAGNGEVSAMFEASRARIEGRPEPSPAGQIIAGGAPRDGLLIPHTVLSEPEDLTAMVDLIEKLAGAPGIVAATSARRKLAALADRVQNPLPRRRVIEDAGAIVLPHDVWRQLARTYEPAKDAAHVGLYLIPADLGVLAYLLFVFETGKLPTSRAYGATFDKEARLITVKQHGMLMPSDPSGRDDPDWRRSLSRLGQDHQKWVEVTGLKGAGAVTIRPGEKMIELEARRAG